MSTYDVVTREGGILPCGLPYLINDSPKRAPGLVKGMHCIAVIKDSERSLMELGPKVFLELHAAALTFALAHASAPGRIRIAYNGPGAAARNHAHVHIILPKDDDKLEPIVAR